VIRRTVRGTGKTLIAAGVLILLFVANQLWGTGIAHDRDQRKLRSKFAAELAAPTTVAAASSPPTTAPGPLAPAEPVCPECAAVINIPKIGLDEVVVEGVGVEELKQGVGHYPDTKLPGEKGNAALAGHRTTYGHPFNRIDELGAGDEITITTRAGTFRYEWMEKQVVTPETVSVLADTPDDRLTLTTCNPKYSAAERLIVVAKLMSPPIAPPAAASTTDTTTPAPSRSHELAAGEAPAGLSGAVSANRPAIAWGIVAASVWLAAWAVGRWSGRRWTAYLVAAPVFLVVLFMFFENFARLLPANV
jgi:sortase A